jgi:predicted HTH transcriptional regulator
VTEEEARALIAMGEGQTIEFKETTATLRKGIKTLAAFGSRDEGGHLFIGVTDAGGIVPFQRARNAEEKWANEIKGNVLSMTTGEPLLPQINSFGNPGFSVISVDGGTDTGPYIAYGRRFERVGKSTHEVQMDYRQLARAFNQHIYDADAAEPLAYRFCERCGNPKLKRSSALDPDHDRMYHFIECSECGWSEWTE